MQLSEHFTLEEFTRSQTASRKGIDNTPTPEALENLKETANAMELVRNRLGGSPITISSGYRSLPLNTAIGSKETSYHLLGLACDFVCPGFGSADDVFVDVANSSIEYDTIILEYNSWVHVQFPKKGSKPRRRSFVIDKKGTRAYVSNED